jgi:glyoxylase-like metal-dependent hydrolase (beta-lactamase superfamily II)
VSAFRSACVGVCLPWVSAFLYSHGDFDHTGIEQVFQEDGATIVAHKNAVDPIIGEKLPQRGSRRDSKVEL